MWLHYLLYFQFVSLSLASVKSRLVLPFWYRLTRVVPEKGPLNGCVCVCFSLFMNSFFDFSSHRTFSRQLRRSTSTRVSFCRHACSLYLLTLFSCLCYGGFLFYMSNLSTWFQAYGDVQCLCLLLYWHLVILQVCCLWEIFSVICYV